MADNNQSLRLQIQQARQELRAAQLKVASLEAQFPQNTSDPLSAGESHYAILDHLIEGCQVIGFDWRYLYLNESAVLHGRRAKEDLLGHTMMECYPGIENTTMFARLRRCMEKRIPDTMHNEFAYPNGKKLWYELSIQPVPQGIFILSLDITERKQAEFAAQRYAQRMEILHQIDLGIIGGGSIENLIDTSLQHIRQLVACQRISVGIIDHTTHELVIFALDSVSNTPISKGVRLPIQADTFEPFSTEHCVIIDDIRPLSKSESAYHQLTREGLISALHANFLIEDQPIGSLNMFATTPGFFTEEHREIAIAIASQLAIAINQMHLSEELERHVDELQQAQATMRQSEARYRSVVEDQTELICRYDSDFRLTFANRAYMEFFGVRPESVIGLNFLDKIPDDYRERAVAHAKKLTAANPVATSEHQVLMPDGTVRWFQWTDRALLDESGSITEYQGVGRDISERKLAEIALRESEQRFQRMADTAPSMLWTTDETGAVSFNSRAWYEYTGVTEEDGLDFGWLNVVHPEDRSQIEAAFLAVVKQPQPYELDYRLRRADGEYRWVIDAGRPSYSASGEFEGYIGSIIENHERKLAQQELQALYNATSHLFTSDNLADLGQQIVQTVVREFQHADCGLMLIDEAQNRIVRFARAGLYELRPGIPLTPDGPGLVPLAARTGSTVYAPDVQQHPSYIASEKRTRSELAIPLMTARGVAAVLDLQRTEIDAFSERDQRVLSAYAERAAAAIENMQLYEALEERVAIRTAELQAAKERVEAILNNSVDGILLAHADLKIQQTNTAFSRLFACETDDYFQKSLLDLVHPDDTQRVETFITTGGESSGNQIEIRASRKDGTVFEAELSVGHIKLNGLVCTIRDISERKRAQNALAEERNLLRTLIDTTPDFIYVKDTQHRFVLSNIAHAKARGCDTPEAMIGKTDFDYFSEYHAQQFHKEEDLLFKTGQPLLNHEQPSLGLKGGFEWALSNKMPLRNLAGEVIGMVGVTHDISERKEQERQLRFHASLQQNVSDAVIATDMGFRIRSWNPAAERMYGWPAAEVIGQSVNDILKTEFPSIEERSRIRDSFLKQGHWNGEFIQLHKDGRQLHIAGSTDLIKDENGVAFGVVSLNHDITERKKAEKALEAKLQEEHEFQTYLKALHDITIELTQVDDLNAFYKRVVELGRERLGFERLALFLYDTITDCAVGTYGTDTEGNIVDEGGVQFRPAPTGMMMRALQREERFSFEETSQLSTATVPSGTGWNAAAILWNGTESLGWLTADNGLHHKPATKPSLDILALYALTIGTQLARKQTQSALKESEARFRSFYEQPLLGMAMSSPQKGMLMVNDKLCEIVGYSRDELLQLSWTAVSHPDDLLADVEQFEQVLAGEIDGYSLDKRFIHKDGRDIYVLMSARCVRDSQGKATHFISLVQDITERRLGEDALQAYAEEVHDLYNSAPCGYHSIDKDGVFVQINDTELNWLGYSRDEVVGKLKITDLFTPESVTIFRENFPTFKERGWVSDLEFDVIRKDGSIRHILLSATAIYDDDGQYLKSRSTLFDISELTQTRQTLIESEARFRLLAENITDVVMQTNLAGDYLYLSPSIRTVLGYEPHEMLGQNGLPYIHPDDLPNIEHAVSALQDPNVARMSLVLRYRHKGGHYIWLETIGQALRSSKTGDLDGFISSSRDISDRKRAEEALRESEERFRLLVNAAPVAIVICDKNGDITLVNNQAEQLFGYNRAELAGRPVEILVPDSARNLHIRHRSSYMSAPIARPMRTGTEFSALRKDGSEFPVEIELSHIERKDDVMVMSFILDITERKRITAELEQQRAFLKQVIDVSPSMIFVKDYDSRFVLVNPMVASVYNTTTEALIGKSDSDLNPSITEVENFLEADRQVIASGQSVFLEEPVTNAAGETRWFQTTKVPIISADGKARHVLGISTDITERRSAETALRQAFEKERELGELKSRFVSMASHEFRTPLATILALTETLSAYWTKLPQDQIESRFDKIRDQVEHLKAIMEDVLLLARMQARRVEFKPALLDLDALCRSVLDEFQSRPEAFKHQLVYTSNLTTPGVYVDRKLIRQIISNLVSNAVKYSPPEKPIHIDLKQTDDALLLTVRDEGIGIPEDDQKYLFEPFHRAANVGTISGTGLGLVITKEAVDLHGGSITVESNVGVGTTFYVRIPNRSEG